MPLDRVCHRREIVDGNHAVIIAVEDIECIAELANLPFNLSFSRKQNKIVRFTQFAIRPALAPEIENFGRTKKLKSADQLPGP